jgi:hypothetical protein
MKFSDSMQQHFRLRVQPQSPLPFLADRRRRGSGRELLARVLLDLQAREGVEIGVRRGGSCLVWCRTNPQLHLTAIDVWRGQRGVREKAIALEQLSGYHVTPCHAASMDVVGTVANRSLDFVHIDGDHTFEGCLLDMIHWSYKLRPGGIMAVHDYHTMAKLGVIQAVNAFTSGKHIDPWYVINDRIPTAVWQKP